MWLINRNIWYYNINQYMVVCRFVDSQIKVFHKFIINYTKCFIYDILLYFLFRDNYHFHLLLPDYKFVIFL